MSFLTRTLPRSFIAGQQMATQSRGFAVSSARMLKESDHRKFPAPQLLLFSSKEEDVKDIVKRGKETDKRI
jgi:hypothetical protein